MRYKGFVYRALTPVYAADPLSGEGARRHGGRFNPRGTPALYLATEFTTAMHETNQVGTFQPTTLVTYEADTGPLFDARDPSALAARGVLPDLISAPTWRDEMDAIGKSRSQILAEDLIADGFAGLLAPSYARGNATNPTATNIVLWKWPDVPAYLRVIDDHGRLAALRKL